MRGFFSRIAKRFAPDKTSPRAFSGEDGILVFANTGEVIRAETILKAGGIPVSVMGPPPALRTGCDMVLAFPLVRELEARKLLDDANLPPLDLLPAAGTLAPVSLFTSKDFGDYLMVRAANMKITVHRKSRRIVNVSGGGCPDVPYLAALMTGKTLDEAPDPARFGSTLCGYALHLAFTELKKQCG